MTKQELSYRKDMKKPHSLRISSFMAKLAIYGFNTAKLDIEYFNDPFINSIYKMVEKNNFVLEEKADVLSNDTVFKKYINELMAAV